MSTSFVQFGTSYLYSARTKEKLNSLASNSPKGTETIVPYINYVFSNKNINCNLIPNWIGSSSDQNKKYKDYLYPYPLNDSHYSYTPPQNDFYTRNVLLTLFSPELLNKDSIKPKGRKGKQPQSFANTPDRFTNINYILKPVSPQSGSTFHALTNVSANTLGPTQVVSNSTRRNIFNTNILFFEKTNKFYKLVKSHELATTPIICFGSLKNTSDNTLPLSIDSNLYRDLKNKSSDSADSSQSVSKKAYSLIYGKEKAGKDTLITASDVSLSKTVIDSDATSALKLKNAFQKRDEIISSDKEADSSVADKSSSTETPSLGFSSSFNYNFYTKLKSLSKTAKQDYKQKTENKNLIYILDYLWEGTDSTGSSGSEDKDKCVTPQFVSYKNTTKLLKSPLSKDSIYVAPQGISASLTPRDYIINTLRNPDDTSNQNNNTATSNPNSQNPTINY